MKTVAGVLALSIWGALAAAVASADTDGGVAPNSIGAEVGSTGNSAPGVAPVGTGTEPATSAPDVASLPPPRTALTPAERARVAALVAEDPILSEQVRAAAKESILEAERSAMEESQNSLFVSQKRFVLIAYGVLWAIVCAFVGLLLLRQRRIASKIALLESQLSALGHSDSSAARPGSPERNVG